MAAATHLLAAYRAAPQAADNPGRDARGHGPARRRRPRIIARRTGAALEYLESALSVTSDGHERVQLLELAAESAQAAAKLNAAEAYARRAIEGTPPTATVRPRQGTTARLGTILALRYQTAESIAIVRAAVEELGEDAALRDDPWLAELRAGLGHSYLLAGRIQEALEWADRAIEGAERLGLMQVMAGALATKGGALFEAGRTKEAIDLLQRSLTSAEGLGLVTLALRARNGLSIGLLADDPRAALDMAATGLEAARRYGLRDHAVRLASNWAVAALEVGEWDDILELVAELDRPDLPLTDRVDFASAAALVLTWRGDPSAAERFAALDKLVAGAKPDLVVATLRERQSAAALALGRPREALDLADVARTAYRATGVRTEILWGAVPAARAALWAGEDDRAARTIDEIEASGLQGRVVSAIVATLRAGLDARRGNVASAVNHYAESRASWRLLDAPLQLALCDVEAARYLPAAALETIVARDEARAILATLGASTLIARLETGVFAASPAARPRGRRGDPSR